MILSRAEQLAHLGADVRSAHECLADQDCLDAGAFQAEHVGACADAALGDETAIRRHVSDQIERVIEAGDERAQIAIVDAQ